MPLRIKLTISFLLISLITAAAVGGIAYNLLMWDFRQSIEDQAFKNFQQDITSYIGAYGSWEQAVRSEPFPEFVRRHRPGPPPPPRGEMPPNSIIPRPGHAPFRFLLLDNQGRVLKPAESYAKGQRVPDAVRRKAQPIQIDGRIVALAAPVGDPIFTAEDRAYLELTQRALITGFLTAAVLALLAGLFLGRRMSAALGEVTKAVRLLQPDGELRLQIPVRSRDEIGILATALNRMSAKLAEAHRTVKIQADEMRELSLRDPLTDLYNRRYFDEQVATLYKQALRHNRPLTVVACDLDFFKQINDRYSHGIGDEVLRRVAQLLKDKTRAGDVIARYGGEEFVIACVDSPLAQTARRCEELRRQIEIHPWHEMHPDLKVTVSMGLSEAVSLPSVEKMLAEADTRLYEAKNSGRNRIMPQAA